MRTRILLVGLAVVALASGAADAQTVAKCDTAGVHAHAPKIPNISTAHQLSQVCPAYDVSVTNYATMRGAAALNAMTGAQAIYEILHGVAPLPVPPDTTKPPKPPVDTTTPPVPATWTFCVNAGNVCEWLGLRTVRLADNATSTKYVTQTAYHTVPCAVYGFQDRNPAPGQSLHCDYGAAMLDTLAVPMPMGPITGPKIIVQKGSPGSGTKDVATGGGNGVRTDGSGSFRTTCSLVKYLFDDPIVYPGKPGQSHLHMFFGSTAINASTDSASIASTGNSSCRGGILNRSSYWTPAMVDAAGNAQMPTEATFYYKTGYNMPPAKTQVLPVGLRMIAGDKNATGPQVAPGPLPITEWTCLVHGGTGSTIPNCAAGDTVRLTVYFPSCWDGKNLDSPDHKSHMAYPNFSAGACPSTHPVQVPQISEHFDWPVPKGANTSTWHLSSDVDLSKPGISAHADWLMGWDVETMRSLVVNCLQKALDCGVGGIGANKYLFQ